MIITRTLIFYAVLVIQVRLMGKRQLSQMEPNEFVVSILIANLAAIPLENLDIPIWSGLIPMAIIFLCERGLSWACLKSIRLRRLLCGKPVILIDNGTILQENLRRTRVNLDEMSYRLREQGILEIETVQFAILETNGSLTVFQYPHFQPASARDAGISTQPQELPYTIISDGRLLRENLHLVGKDEMWLSGFLAGKGCALDRVLLLTVTKSGKTALFSRASDSAKP